MVSGSTPKSAKDRQVATVLYPEDFAILDRMAGNLNISRAEAARQLVHQGIVGLKAAAEAADDGRTDLDAAALFAMQLAQIEAEVVKLHLDALCGHLDAVAVRNWRDAVLLASGAAEAIGQWGDQLADAHGTTVDELAGRAVERVG